MDVVLSGLLNRSAASAMVPALGTCESKSIEGHTVQPTTSPFMIETADIVADAAIRRWESSQSLGQYKEDEGVSRSDWMVHIV